MLVYMENEGTSVPDWKVSEVGSILPQVVSILCIQTRAYSHSVWHHRFNLRKSLPHHAHSSKLDMDKYARA